MFPQRGRPSVLLALNRKKKKIAALLGQKIGPRGGVLVSMSPTQVVVFLLQVLAAGLTPLRVGATVT